MVAFEHPHPHGALEPTAHLELPFFGDAHRALANRLAAWAREQLVDESDDRAACKDWVQRLGAAGWLRYCVPAAHGGALPVLDSRALVILRETLAYHSPLADFAFAMQGLGSGAITLAGTTRATSHLAAVGGKRREDRGLRAQRTRGRVGRGWHAPARRPLRRRLAAGRPEDLDQQRRPGRLLRHLRQGRPGRWRAWHQRLHRPSRTRPVWTAVRISR